MDFYSLAKFLHVAFAVLWLGGGFGLMLAAAVADRARNRDDFLAAMRLTTVLAPRLFVPGSLVVLVLGLAMMTLGGWRFDAWIVIGLLGFVAASAIGAGKLGPAAAATGRLAAEGRFVEAVATGRAMLRFARVEYVIQAVIVFVMVVKPGWSDHALLSGLALAAGAAILAILTAPVRPAGTMRTAA